MKRLAASIGLVLIVSSPVVGGQRQEPSCSLTPTLLSAVDLPIDISFGFTFQPYPSVGLRTQDGTFSREGTYIAPLTAYFWVRGHGPSLIKAGPQLNDYHVIAICSV